MADTKISGFTDGATANATDRIAAIRSPFGGGDDRYLTPTYIKNYTLDLPYTTQSTTGDDTTQSGTVTKGCGTITTGALTTAAAGSTAVVLTLTGVVAADPVFVTQAGGTNTRSYEVFSAITTTDTITVTLRNVDLVNALNGTVKFHYLWIKA